MHNFMSQPIDPETVIGTERVLPFTPRQIFTAFERPEVLAQWWGPDGFTNTFQQCDFKPGGRWIFVMHGPNGATFPNESVFLEIVSDSKIVIDHVCAPRFVLTITLTPRGDETHLSWIGVVENADVAASIRSFATPGMEQTLDRLEAVLASECK